LTTGAVQALGANGLEWCCSFHSAYPHAFSACRKRS
jgi:hypothetical protein